MKTTLKILAIVSVPMLFGPAHAEPRNATIVRGIANMMIYDQQCESLPKYAMNMVDAALKAIGVKEKAGKVHVNEAIAEYKSMGPRAFCDKMKPMIENLIETLN